MTYNQWNQLLIDFYFHTQDGHEIFLAIDKDTLLDYAEETGCFKESFQYICSKNPECKINIRAYIWRDFIHLFYLGSLQCKTGLLNFLSNKFKESVRSQSPEFLPCLVLFLLPLSNNPEMNANNFYGRINDFLHSVCLLKSSERIGSNDFSSFSTPSLPEVWDLLVLWAQRKGYHYRVKTNSKKFQFVAPFLAESLFTPSQREKFKIIFFKAGLSPDQELTESRKSHILNLYHNFLGYTDDSSWRNIFLEYHDIILSEFTRQYDKWDGRTIVKERQNDRRILKDYGVNYPLYIELNLFRGRPKFSLYALYPNSEMGTEYEYSCHDSSDISCNFIVDYEGYAAPSFNDGISEEELLQRYVGKGQKLSFDSISNNNHLTLELQNYYLFELYMGSYRISKGLQKGGKYYILIKSTAIQDFEKWLEFNSAQIINFEHAFSTKYQLYFIPDLKSFLDSKKSLAAPVNISIQLCNTFYISKTAHHISIYKNQPAYFLIDGVDIVNDRIDAVFNCDGINKRQTLKYQPSSKLWKLEKLSNVYLLESEFRIFCNDEEISSQSFSFGSFKMLENDDYKPIMLDRWGNYTSDTNLAVTDGLKLNIRAGIPEALNKRYNKLPNFTSCEYHNNDMILYWLSMHSDVSKRAFEEIVQIQMFKENLVLKQRVNVNELRDNYYRLGYINYVYKNDGYHITVNRPTLILLPTNYTIDVIPGLDNTLMTPTKEYWKCLLTGARTPDFIASLLKRIQNFSYQGDKLILQIEEQNNLLLPQKITVWSPSVDAISAFATQFDIEFQPFFYSIELLNSLGSVDDYLQSCIVEYADYDKTYEGFSEYENIDYKTLGQDSENKNVPQNLRKYLVKDFNRNCAVVKYFPGTYQEQSILWLEGKQYPVDKFWGDFIGLKLSGSKVLKVDYVNKELCLPKFMKLPLIYARALTMLTGEAPDTNEIIRVYQFCNNPVTKINNLLSKLNQL